MRREIISCDCCKAVIKSDIWQHAPIKIEIGTPSQNPLGALDEKPGYQNVILVFPEVCDECSRRIAQAVADIIQKIRGEGYS